jgi:RNase P/RNase MRP subunit POP5
MKSLIPSHKENKRYLLIQGKDLKKNVEKAILEFGGSLGMSQCGLSFIKNNIICVNRKSLDLVKGSFAIFPEKIEVLKVSGTLKGLGIKA